MRGIGQRAAAGPNLWTNDALWTADLTATHDVAITIAPVQPGAIVRGNDGRYIGRIAAVDGSRVTIQHNGDRNAVLPRNALWFMDGGLILQMGRSTFTHWAASQSNHH